MYGNADLDAGLERSIPPLYKHVAKTYAWMFLGLLITFLTGTALYMTGAYILFFSSSVVPILLLVAQLGLVWFLSSRITTFSVGAVRGIFVAYAVLTGVVFSTIPLLYGASSAILAFGVASLFFGVMAAAGLITKRDVSRFAPIVSIGLITLIVMSLISMFLHLEALDTAICFLGIALFLGITTYDAKKTKDLYYAYENNAEMLDKVSIYSALNLYLDFINLFLYLLRLLGRKR